jgi:hypothetical protein
MMVFLRRQWQGLGSTSRKKGVVALFALGGVLAGCGGDAPAESDAELGGAEDAILQAEAALPAVVRIVAPLDGATLEGGEVEIVLTSENVEIAPVGDGRMGTAHHHLFVNTDVTPMGEVIPMGRDGIIHMGDGSTSFTLRDLTPGEYRIIAVLADLLHVPLDPPAVDTIFITIR